MTPKRNFENRTLFHCDNLPVLQGMNSETIDLIATDPPFNKNKDFHATPDSLAKNARFTDRWDWDKDVHPEWVDQIQDDWPGVHAVIEAAKAASGMDMAAFLCWIGVRLMEMRRVLKPTGSVYLHIDHTAHAYVKTLMDAIFGRDNFLNEIVWCYKSGGASPKRHFSRKHDTILFYRRSLSYHFNPQQEKSYNRGLKPYRFAGVAEYQDDIGWHTLVGMKDYWNIDMVGRTSSERTGYPTQKPLALYERIIKASSNPGDIVLDPFAGCATTPVAAERLGREWIGIDIWDSAYKTVLDRLEAEGLAVPETDHAAQSHLLTFGQIHYRSAPPIRDDDDAIPVPDLKLKLQRAKERWQKLSHKEMVTILADAQSSADGVICAVCGRVLEVEFMELDHVQPKSSPRGTIYIDNRVLICRPCNGKKSNRMTLNGLWRENEKDGWIRNADLASIAESKAYDRALQVKDEMYGVSA